MILDMFRAIPCALVENGQSPLSTSALYGRLQRVTIPDAVIIQLDLLRMMGFDPRTVQPVASRYSGYAIPATLRTER
jgi:hypothetical protein